LSAAIFDFVCEALEQATDLETLEARGTVRLSLKHSGLDAASVTASQMAVMLKRVMPKELSSRGVDGAEALCDALIGKLKEFRLSHGDEDSAPESPEEIFRRLSGR
jgi:hypothetical protein